MPIAQRTEYYINGKYFTHSKDVFMIWMLQEQERRLDYRSKCVDTLNDAEDAVKEIDKAIQDNA